MGKRRKKAKESVNNDVSDLVDEAPEVTEPKVTEPKVTEPDTFEMVVKKGEVIPPMDHKSYVGPKEQYDEIGSHQVTLLKALGLRTMSKLLDIGCGSLRAGKYLIPYLNRGNYYGVEPNQGLLKTGLVKEVGFEVYEKKMPLFAFNDKFDFSVFDEEFDFVVAQSIFSHAAPAQIETCLKNAAATMKKGGILAFSYLKGGCDYTGQSWVYPNGVKYTEKTMLDFVKKAKLTVEKSKFTHPNGLTWIIVKKP